MINTHELNVALLRTIEEELGEAISNASLALQKHLEQPEETESLNECLKGLNQIRGALKLTQFYGAHELADAMQVTLERLEAGQAGNETRCLEALSEGFLLLPRFIEFSINHKQAIPILLENNINLLKAACQLELVAETQFSEFSYQNCEGDTPGGELTKPQESLESVIRRLRHMYQVGLLAIIKSGYSEKQAQLLARAIERIRPYLDSGDMAELFWLTGIVVNALAEGRLSGSLARTRLLARIDRVLRAIATDKETGLQQGIEDDLLEQLLFLVALAKSDNEDYLLVTSRYQLPEASLTDCGIRQLREQMQGPNSKTVKSMILAVKEELLMAKDIFEIAAQQDVSASEGDLNKALKALQRLTEVFKVVDLGAAAQTLGDITAKVQAWVNDNAEVDRDDLVELAESIVHVESTLSNLEASGFNAQALHQVSGLVPQHDTSNSHLADAELSVLQEAQSSIALSKRAISSYIESNYQAEHIANVGTTLHSVKGGVSVLNLPRASAVLDACIAFIDKELPNISNESAERSEELLATLADALIAIEYYLDEVINQRDADDNVLGVAEKSLEALGYLSAGVEP